MEGLTITGNTPFERATQGRLKGQLFLVTHLAVKELVEQLDECDKQLAEWQQEVIEGRSTEASLALATQALKDKKLFTKALIAVTESAAQDLDLEA